MEKYYLTDDHKSQLKPWADKWIANAMSTKAMDDTDRSIMKSAIKGLYESAGLESPPEHRIIFVPSPFVARFSGGFAAAIWWNIKNNKNISATYAATRDATSDATRDATRAATDDATCAATSDATDDATRDATCAATYAATRDATRDATCDATDAATDAATCDATDAATDAATDDATYAATYAATRDATCDATRAATRDATSDATYAATCAATRDATSDATYAAKNKIFDKNSWFAFDIKGMISISTDLKIGEFGLKCAAEASKMYQGGNFWSPWDSFLSFFKNIVKLEIDYSKYEHWEKAAQHGSYRIMHPKFCIISDRPCQLSVDDQNRPHSFDGPYCAWRDGSALYSIHGIRVPAWIPETKREDFTKEMILQEENADFRRCIIEKIGIKRAIELLGAVTVDSFQGNVGGKYELLKIDYDGRGNQRSYLKMINPSIKVDHIEGVLSEKHTVQDAICFRNNLTTFIEPEHLS